MFCAAYFIRIDVLTASIIKNLRKVTSYAIKHEAGFTKLIAEQNEAGSKRKTAAMKKSVEDTQSRIAELSKIIKRHMNFEEQNQRRKVEFCNFLR